MMHLDAFVDETTWESKDENASTQNIALSIMTEDMTNEEQCHSLPNPDPRSKPYGSKENARKRNACVLAMTILLILGIIAAFVGGYASKSGTETTSMIMSNSEKSIDTPVSVRYRHRRVHEKTRNHKKEFQLAKKEFHLANIFIP